MGTSVCKQSDETVTVLPTVPAVPNFLRRMQFCHGVQDDPPWGPSETSLIIYEERTIGHAWTPANSSLQRLHLSSAGREFLYDEMRHIILFRRS